MQDIFSPFIGISPLHRHFPPSSVCRIYFPPSPFLGMQDIFSALPNAYNRLKRNPKNDPSDGYPKNFTPYLKLDTNKQLVVLLMSSAFPWLTEDDRQRVVPSLNALLVLLLFSLFRWVNLLKLWPFFEAFNSATHKCVFLTTVSCSVAPLVPH